MGEAEGKDWKHEAYLDLAKPIASQIGETAGELVARAILPAKAVIWGWDRIAEVIGPRLKRMLQPVHSGRLQAPDPAVVVPLVQALTYTGHEEPLVDLFARLLASSMDADSAKYAHPSFAAILRELTPDEARFLNFLIPGLHYKTQVQLSLSDEASSSETSSSFSLLGRMTDLGLGDSGLSLLNLSRAGILDISTGQDTFLAVEVRIGDDAQIGQAVEEMMRRLSISNLPLRGEVIRESVSHTLGHAGPVFRESAGGMLRIRGSFQDRLSLTAFGEQLYMACVRGPR